MTRNIYLYAVGHQIDTSSLKLSLEFWTPSPTSHLASLHESVLGISNLTCLEPDNIHTHFAVLHLPHLNTWHLYLVRFLG